MKIIFAFYGGYLSEAVFDLDLSDSTAVGSSDVAVQCYRITGGQVGAQFWAVPKTFVRECEKSSCIPDSATETRHAILADAAHNPFVVPPHKYEIIERLQQEDTVVLVIEHLLRPRCRGGSNCRRPKTPVTNFDNRRPELRSPRRFDFFWVRAGGSFLFLTESDSGWKLAVSVCLPRP